jgi:hypothetical protein
LSFTQKAITYTISLASGGGMTTHPGLRSTCEITNAGGPSFGTADITIYGMTLSEMNSLTTLGTNVNVVHDNKISVLAGDSAGNMSLVFKGTMILAWVDAQNMPEVCFRIHAMGGAYEAVMPSKPTSVQGSGDVATVMGQIAQKMGMQFENNNVNVKLQNLYLSGSYRQQMLELVEHAGIQGFIENGTLVIVPNGKARNGGGVIASKQTGMVGYPTYFQGGIIVTMLFNPALRLQDKIQVQSELTPASGSWVIFNLVHELDAVTPHGRWFSIVKAGNISADGQPSGDQA